MGLRKQLVSIYNQSEDYLNDPEQELLKIIEARLYSWKCFDSFTVFISLIQRKNF